MGSQGQDEARGRTTTKTFAYQTFYLTLFKQVHGVRLI
jgi:hypothetical protein